MQPLASVASHIAVAHKKVRRHATSIVLVTNDVLVGQNS